MRSKIPFLLILLLGAIPAFSEKVPINTPLPVKAASSMNPEDLLRLIENYHSFGCDLNEDGQTDLLDILIAARDGVVDCPYNIPFYINSDPGSATAFVVGRFPNQVILYGNKDAQGNLMEALSLEIQFKNEQSIFLSLDPAGFPDGVTAELGALQIAFASPDIIAYEGWIDGVSAEGDALAAMDFSAFTAGYEDLDSKRSLPAAILDCTEEKSEIVTEILFPQTYPLTEVSEGAILFLSYLLLESDLPCECLSKAFFDDPDTPMVRQLIALQKLMVRIRIRGQQILGVYKECANSPGCVPALKDRLESMLKDFNKALFVILWISDDLFEQIAMTIEGCGLPTPTPQPSFPTGEYVMIGGYLADEQAGMLEKYLVNITYDHDNIYRINTSRRGYDATASGGSLVVHTTYSGTTEDAVYTDIGNNRYSVSITYSYPGDDYFVEGTL
ncbi:MAG: hypothetical protein KC940_05275, partial [Candidatus Omnitrophica bacterium]|nr:hypothetical protein [Candidatus Omnitrophota bacterium]